jgi:uncharacterized protein (TIGR02594 family)
MNKAFEIALSFYGTKEIKGTVDNPTIVQMFADAGHDWVKDDETAWCAAFVGACLEEAGIKSTKKLNARSYLEWGEATDKPKLGDIVVFWRGKKNSWQGHVAFYVNETQTHINVLGGNQGDEVNITRYSKDRLLGCRAVKDFLTTPHADGEPMIPSSKVKALLLAVIKQLAK